MMFTTDIGEAPNGQGMGREANENELEEAIDELAVAMTSVKQKQECMQV